MSFPERYKAEIVSAVESIDINEVTDVIELFKQTMSRGHNIFICANTSSACTASRVVADMMMRSSFGGTARFRVFALHNGPPESGFGEDGGRGDGIFVEQLKNFAEPNDVVVGISASGCCSPIIRALDYGAGIGCKTVALTGAEAGKLGVRADITVHVASTDLAAVEDAQIMICHMIGSYFLNSDRQ